MNIQLFVIAAFYLSLCIDSFTSNQPQMGWVYFGLIIVNFALAWR